MRKVALLLAFLVFGVAASNAQNVAIKTNLLHDATQSINLGIEIALNAYIRLILFERDK